MSTATRISTAALVGGETVALGCWEITAVPRYDAVDPGVRSAEAAIVRLSGETTSLLGEMYQVQQAVYAESGCEVALELAWATHSVEQQAYRAGIRLLIIARALSDSADVASEVCRSMLNSMESLLIAERYEYRAADASVLEEALAHVPLDAAFCVKKRARVENLQNPIVPMCFMFDTWNPIVDDMGRLVDALSEHPGCAMLLQLVPTALSVDEGGELDRMTQLLESLMRGVSGFGYGGTVSYALAGSPAATYRYYAERKSSPLFACNLVVVGNHEAASVVASRLAGHIASGENAGASLSIEGLDPSCVDFRENLFPLPWAVSEMLAVQSWQLSQQLGAPASLARLPLLFAAEEAASLLRLPQASGRVFRGLRVSELDKVGKTFAEGVINAGDFTVGRLAASTQGNMVGLELDDFAKHMLVVGTPGSGKTTFVVGMLSRLWREHGVPFLVIEPAKKEYRALLDVIPDLQIFTPGKSSVAPWVCNPFVPPRNVRLEAHKSALKTAFSAGIPMETPIDKIFDDTLVNCYSDHRWLDTYTTEEGGRIFDIEDFIKCFQETFESIGYTGDAANIGRAGTVRLKSLVGLFDSYGTVPIEDLLSRPTVVELNAIENTGQKALIIALLLLSIKEYFDANVEATGGLRSLLVLEEAHVLLDGAGSGAKGESDPTRLAQELFARMLAEKRSSGLGIVVADQSPRKVTSDVMALTDIKLAFRLVEAADRKILGDSTNMAEAQVQRLGRLHPGEAFLFFTRLSEVEEIVTPNFRKEDGLRITISDDEVAERCRYWRDHTELSRPYPECAMCAHCLGRCELERRVLARDAARRIVSRSLPAGTRDVELLRKMLSRISALIASELDGCEASPALVQCVKVHLWRRIRYDTKLPITDEHIRRSLER